ncbi:hypothetical protein VTN49DRAFT_1508 [Thermomyces lanuginosus]|uniref:uncharacterized protein n=1 Tax=Thermomyces lanuginosus TaxID=5541 RepID=UPI003742923D
MFNSEPSTSSVAQETSLKENKNSKSNQPVQQDEPLCSDDVMMMIRMKKVKPANGSDDMQRCKAWKVM